MKQVEGHPNLVRNNIGVIVNTDSAGLVKHLQTKQKLREKDNRIDKLEKTVEEIKQKLETLMNRP